MIAPRDSLRTVVEGIGPLAVAVSGGVDSLTLAAFAHRVLGPGAALMVHAASPAVPGEATIRVRDEAAREGWTLRVIEAGEFSDPAYRANPVNRCFFCKTNLYGAIRHVTDRRIVSGANLDDLGEYRPGLDAAREHGVRHPYVEAGLDKAAVRALSRDLGLGAVADLPSAPCLSSRVETGVRIEPEVLAFIHIVERHAADRLGASGDPRRAVRCRVRAAGVVVELDPASLATLDHEGRTDLGAWIAAQAPESLRSGPVRFEPYRTGSAFLVGTGAERVSVAEEFTLDFARPERIGLEEAVFCAGKSAVQIDAILDAAAVREARFLLTRLDTERYAALSHPHRQALDYCPVSRTAFFGEARPVGELARVAIVAAGTSDVSVAREAERTLAYQGRASTLIADVGVAGLWRLTRRLEEIAAHPIVIVVAGMDAALASVLGGLVSGCVVAVPTSVGYGVAEGGQTALHAMLASCAPGLTVVNIDNGYGAACAALRLLDAADRLRAAG